MNIIQATTACSGCAVLCTVGVFLIHGKDREHKPMVIYWTRSIRQGTTAMEEEIIQTRCLVWYHGGLPTYEWRTREERLAA